MKLAVAVKQVLDLDDEAELAAGPPWVELDPSQGGLNEWDTFALETALTLRDAHRGEVVALSVGGPEADEALVASLALGVDRAIHIERELGALQDPLAVARSLASVLADERPDLILCGVQSSDGRSGCTGPALAGLLDLPIATVVTEIDLDEGATGLSVARELEGGLVERLVLSTPAVITVQTGANEPRYANLRAIKLAEKQERERIAAPPGDEQRIDHANGRLRSVARPSGVDRATLIEGDASVIARRISDLIDERVMR